MTTSPIELVRRGPAASVGGMDRPASRNRWSPAQWPFAAKVAAAVLGPLVAILTAVALFAGSDGSTLRIPMAQLTIATVAQGVFHDLIPLRANVQPRETVYIDAIDGGRIDRVL